VGMCGVLQGAIKRRKGPGFEGKTHHYQQARYRKGEGGWNRGTFQKHKIMKGPWGKIKKSVGGG